jgi:hypothetical protein
MKHLNFLLSMMKLDGSAMHKHTITAADFKLTGRTSARIYNGTATISMKEGSVSNVPINIEVY